jgi:hypothetical protein
MGAQPRPDARRSDARPAATICGSEADEARACGDDCLTGARCDELGLRQMTERNETPYGTAFTVSIEAREGISTGISAYDRARTIQVAIGPSRGREDLVEPGHVFRYGRGPAASWSAQAKPRRPWI